MTASLLEELEDELNEFNAVSTGQVVGYTAPLGMDVSGYHDKLWSGSASEQDKKKTKNSKNQWYEIKNESLNEDQLDEIDYYYPVGRSMPDHMKDQGALTVDKDDEGLLDTKKLEKDRNKKDHWYKNEETIAATFDHSVSKLNESRLDEQLSLNTTSISMSMSLKDRWMWQNCNPEYTDRNWKELKDYIERMDLDPVELYGYVFPVYGTQMDPQLERTKSIYDDVNGAKPIKEPDYPEPDDNSLAAQMGYTKIGEQDALAGEVRLMQYDPRHVRSQKIVQQSLEHQKFNRENPNRATMYVSIKEAMNDPQISTFYHGTSADLSVGDDVQPPAKTGKQSEKGRKKNLNKVFITTDPKYAKIYADKAKDVLGGTPKVYAVEPKGEVENIQNKPGAKVYKTDSATVIKQVM